MIATLLALWAMLLVAGGTPAGRLMRRMVVEWPAARLARVSRGAVIVWLILGAIGALCFWFLEEDGLRLFTMAMPEVAGWITAFEIGSTVEALVVAVTAASTLRMGRVRGWLAARMRIAPRTKRARRTRPAVRVPANDDEDGGGIALAA